VRWALEETVANPTLLRLHVDEELTTHTIVSCPPGTPPEPLDRLFEIEAIVRIDLHRYRARLQLRPDADRPSAADHARGVLASFLGPAADLPPDEGPRAFGSAYSGERRVAESPAMAEGLPLFEALFDLEGIVEAIAAPHLVLVRLGRLHAWADVEAGVATVVQSSTDSGGMPGSTSGSS
jgi:hypothetical protein